MDQPLKGIFIILPTPFDQQRRIDFTSLTRLVDFELNAGVHGITLLGILGEVMRLSETEKREITRAVVDQVKGRVPVVAGTGASGTDLAIMYSKEAEEIGVDAIMVAPPRLLKPNEDTIFNYYRDIAKDVDLPVVIQDEPTTYGVYMSPSLIARLSTIEKVEYVKLEDAPTPLKITTIRNLIQDKLRIFGGLGGLYFYEELLRGACGIMTGFAYPEILVRIYEDFLKGNRLSSRDLFYSILPLIRYEAQPLVSLAIRKEILRRRGLIKSAIVRDPATKLDSESLKEIDELLKTVEQKVRLT
jgi:4-hydroxy-tetrahydrodipicolinate synthase